MKRLLFMCAIVCVSPFPATAHSLGASLERATGDYWIDIGYDPSIVSGGDRVVFDLNLAEAAATTTPVAYDYVWLRLHGGNTTLIATGIARADIGPTTLLYTMPSDIEGDLTLSVRFSKGGEALAEADFPLPVIARETPIDWQPYAVGAGAMLGLCALAALAWRAWRMHA